MDSHWMWVCLLLGVFLPLNHGQGPPYNCFKKDTLIDGITGFPWFCGYKDQFRAPQGLKIKTFGDEKFENSMYSSQNSPTDTFTCKANVHKALPLRYRLVENGAGDKKCIEMYEEKKNLLLMHEVPAPSATSASSCPDLISNNNALGDGLSKISVPYNGGFDFSGSNCGDLPNRTYHATVNTSTTTCDASNSKVTISNTEFTMDTCAAGNTYNKPFSNSVKLRCVAQISPVVLGNTQKQGSIFILAYENTYSASYAGAYSFYCVSTMKYDDPGNPRILMSFDSSAQNDPACRYVLERTEQDPKGYELVGKNPLLFGDYQHLILRPNDCPTACKNGGTCTQFMEYFECECADGWTGTICDKSIDECASTPCLNGGTCIDGHLMYTCSCTMYYEGTRCGDPICLIPSEMAGKWYGAVEMDSSDDAEYLFEVIAHIDEIKYNNNTGGVGYTFSSECDAKSFDENWNTIYYTRTSAAGDIDDTICHKVKLPGWASTTHPFWWYKVGTTSTVTTPASCNNVGNLVYVMGKKPYSTTGTNSFTEVQGSYEGLEYKSGDTTPWTCSYTGATDSTASIPDSTQIKMRACQLSMVSPSEPYGDWRSVGQYTGSDLWTSGEHKYIFLLHETAAKRYLICARFMDTPQEEFNIHLNRKVYYIKLTMYTAGSLDNENNDDGEPYEAICKNYNVDASANTGNDQAIRLISDKCNLAANECQNNGTCENLWHDSYCKCEPGWTGRYCEISINDCPDPNPCLNGGTCVDGHMSWTCDCVTAFTGDICQYFDDCEPNPCIHGNCTDYNNEVRDTIKCNCDTGYRGSRCENDMNECDIIKPCQNGGTCYDSTTNGTATVQVALGVYKCVCPPGFRGSNCEENINDCARFNWPCQNGGTCLDRIEAYYCRCTEKWIGVHCEHFNECWNITCQNGGTCVDDWKEYSGCFCHEGYTGKYCQKIDTSCELTGCGVNGDCVAVDGGGKTCRCSAGYHGLKCQWTNMCYQSSLCANGGGCIPNEASFACACTDEWTGPTCGINSGQIYTGIVPTTRAPQTLDTVTTIIIVIAVVVAVAIIIVVIWFMVRHYAAAGAAAGAGARNPGSPAYSWQPAYSKQHA